MRCTEYIHFMNRTDIGLGVNPPERDYTHYTPRMFREQVKLKGKDK